MLPVFHINFKGEKKSLLSCMSSGLPVKSVALQPFSLGFVGSELCLALSTLVALRWHWPSVGPVGLGPCVERELRAGTQATLCLLINSPHTQSWRKAGAALPALTVFY